MADKPSASRASKPNLRLEDDDVFPQPTTGSSLRTLFDRIDQHDADIDALRAGMSSVSNDVSDLRHSAHRLEDEFGQVHNLMAMMQRTSEEFSVTFATHAATEDAREAERAALAKKSVESADRFRQWLAVLITLATAIGSAIGWTLALKH